MPVRATSGRSTERAAGSRRGLHGRPIERAGQSSRELRAKRWAPSVACAAATLLVLAPLLRPGFVLSFDMVFTPDAPLAPRSVGLGPQLPRAVPVDAVVSLLSDAVPGQVLQKAALAAALFGAGLGAAAAAGHLAREIRQPVTVAAVAAGVSYVWNPYVAERLVIGHWSLLLAYAALPWVLHACWHRPAWPRLAVGLAVGALTPTGGPLAALVAVAALRRLRHRLVAVLLAAVLNGPWLVPALLHPSSGTADPAGVAAFALRAEGWTGRMGAALGLGGIWNADAVPASRALAPVQVVSLVVLGAALLGAWSLRRSPHASGLAACAVLGLGLALASSMPGGSGFQMWLTTHVPGAGLLRDAQKWLALFALPLALAFGTAAARAARAVGARAVREERRAVLVGVTTVAALLPVLTVPDLAWGVAGRLSPVDYPHDWAAVRSVLAPVPRRDRVVVVPYQPFRAFAWNRGRTVLDPAPRWYAQDLIVSDDLPVGRSVVRGESPEAAAVGSALRGARPWEALRGLGVEWVLVEHGTPGTVPGGLGSAGMPLYRGPDLTLVRLAPAGAPTPGPVRVPPVVPVLAADGVALLVLGAAVTSEVLTTARRRLRGRRTGRGR